MSASVQPELRKRCRDAGFRDFLPKPLAAGELQSALVRGSRRNSAIVGPDTTLTSSPTTGASGAIERMREIFAQSPDAYRDLLKSHIEQTDLLCADLEQSLTGRADPETARRATHTLQAAAASFGCDKVAAHARTIEAEWDALTPERRHILTRRLIDAWRDEERDEIVRELESFRTSNASR
jgi:HPt (histidine-containing phosphotransfer) domain-containing protein